MKKSVIIVISVAAVAVVGAGLGVLIWWLVTRNYIDDTDGPNGTDGINETISVIEVEGPGFGELYHKAAFTRFPGVGDLFWWFYPTTAASATSKPIILWLDGITGLPPSLLANFGMFGPFDSNLNSRPDSLIDDYNLLFVDAPIGTGFSTPLQTGSIPSTFDDNAYYLYKSLGSFYNLHSQYNNTPLYIVGQGSGAPLAVSLTVYLSKVDLTTACDINHDVVVDENDTFCFNLQGVIIGNGIISPAKALTELGFYLEEWAYVDGVGRDAIETLSTSVNSLMNEQKYDEAFDKFLSLDDYINNEAGAFAINLGHIVQRLRNTTIASDTFRQREYLENTLPTDISAFMDGTVATALGIESPSYDKGRVQAQESVKDTFMIPIVDKVEYILQNTSLSVTIYNGNLDAISNTPGQLEWVNNLQWPHQQNFASSERYTLAYEGLIQGYVREFDRLAFYWINAAGLSVPYDSPAAMRCILERVTSTTLDSNSYIVDSYY